MACAAPLGAIQSDIFNDSIVGFGLGMLGMLGMVTMLSLMGVLLDVVGLVLGMLRGAGHT
jgi:hypothetical protein